MMVFTYIVRRPMYSIQFTQVVHFTKCRLPFCMKERATNHCWPQSGIVGQTSISLFKRLNINHNNLEEKYSLRLGMSKTFIEG